ncbi:MAG: hypothetical protein H0T53_13060 [Herpetosiphonaceae bacterium]|nr:hypothetical protein [Herpetosiphonaceae bacterium]
MIDRPLGAIEQLNWLIEQTAATNVTAFAEVSGPILPRLSIALDMLQRRHPLLRTHIVHTNFRAPRFRAGVSPIPFQVVDAESAAVVGAVEHELNSAFPAAGPLARCVVLRHTEDTATIILSFQHTLGDGMSSVTLMRDLLEAIAQSQDGAPSPAPLTLRPAVETFLPAAGRGLRGIVNIVRMLARQSKMDTTAVTHDGQAAHDKVHTAIGSYYLEPSLTRALVAKARSHGTTVHGVLCAAVFLAVEKDFARTEAVPLSCVVPVDLHARVEPTIGEELLLFNAPVTVYYRGGSARSVWEVASDITGKLNDSITRNEHFAGLSLMRLVSSLLARRRAKPNGEQGMQELVAKTEVPTFLFSNLGALKINHSYGPITLHSFGFAGGLAFTMDLGCYIATLNDVLCWTFVWKEPRLSRSHIDRIVTWSLELVREAVSA